MDPRTIAQNIKKARVKPVSVHELMPYAHNANVHPQWQIRQIVNSIQEFGFTNPVLIDTEGTIIAGHGRVLAAHEIGLEEVPCMTLDNLTAGQLRAYILADNQIARNAETDPKVLSQELVELQKLDVNLELLGYDHDTLQTHIHLDTHTTEETEPYLKSPSYTFFVRCQSGSEMTRLREFFGVQKSSIDYAQAEAKLRL